MLAESAIKLAKAGKTVSKFWSCTSGGTNNQTKADFESYLKQRLNTSRYILQRDKNDVPLLMPFIKMNVRLQNKSDAITVGSWDPEAKFSPASGYQVQKIKRFFRVGVVLGLPWAWVNNSEFPLNATSLNKSMPNKGTAHYFASILSIKKIVVRRGRKRGKTV